MEDKYRKIAIGNRIKEIRKGQGLSQKQLHEKSGVTETEISYYETGKRVPTLPNIAKIAHALGATIDYLYFGDGSNSFIENAPNYGMKIVNCITELRREGVTGAVIREKVSYNTTCTSIILEKEEDAIERLVESLDNFERNRETYPDPDSFLEQLKQSVANEINNSKNDDFIVEEPPF